MLNILCETCLKEVYSQIHLSVSFILTLNSKRNPIHTALNANVIIRLKLSESRKMSKGEKIYLYKLKIRIFFQCSRLVCDAYTYTYVVIWVFGEIESSRLRSAFIFDLLGNSIETHIFHICCCCNLANFSVVLLKLPIISQIFMLYTSTSKYKEQTKKKKPMKFFQRSNLGLPIAIFVSSYLIIWFINDKRIISTTQQYKAKTKMTNN